MRTLERCLKNRSGKQNGVGLIIVDRRSENVDKNMIASAQSLLFRNNFSFERIIESPLVVDSKYYHGVQVADIICGILGGVFRWRKAQQYSANYKHNDDRFGAFIDKLTYTDNRNLKTVWVD